MDFTHTSSNNIYVIFQYKKKNFNTVITFKALNIFQTSCSQNIRRENYKKLLEPSLCNSHYPQLLNTECDPSCDHLREKCTEHFFNRHFNKFY